MKQRQSALKRRADLPDRGHLRGMVTLVQEDRFRLMDDLGRGYLFTLGRGSGVSLRELLAWCELGVTVEVEYRGAPDLGAVAVGAACRSGSNSS
jgi:hypothetical protein